MFRATALSCVLATGFFATAVDTPQQQQTQAHMGETTEQLQRQVTELQREVAELRVREHLDSRYLMVLSDPELAALAALDETKAMPREDRIELLSQLLGHPGHTRVVRNAMYLMLIEDLQAEGLAAESARLVERMMSENALEPTRLNQRVPTGQRVPFGPRVGPRYRPFYGDPTGRRLELELRSPHIYRGHPDDDYHFDRFLPYDRPRYYRDPFDRPWFDDPRWRPRWWR